MLKVVSSITAILTLVGIFIGGYIFIDDRYVQREKLTNLEIRLEIEIKALSKRLELKINDDYLDDVQARIWTIEDRIKERPDDVTLKEDLRELKKDMKELELKQSILMKNFTGQ